MFKLTTFLRFVTPPPPLQQQQAASDENCTSLKIAPKYEAEKLSGWPEPEGDGKEDTERRVNK